MAYYVKLTYRVSVGHEDIGVADLKMPKGKNTSRHKSRPWARAAVVSMLVVGLVGFNILLSVQITALDLDFYTAKWEELDIPESARIPMEELKMVGMRLQGYLTGKNSTPQLDVTINDTLRPLYRQNEIEHLKDVRALFQLGFLAKRICLGLIVLGVVFAALVPRAKLLVGKSLKISAIVLIALILLLTIPPALNFTDWWTNFHIVIFPNELWLLDPNLDWLIKIFPEEFFYSAVKRTGFCSLIISAIYYGMGLGIRAFCKRFLRRPR